MRIMSAAAVLPLEPPRKRWTRTQCAALEASGVFEREHLELINGELISKMGQNRPHAVSLARLHAWLMRVFGESFVHQEAPIDVHPADNPTNEPEPDVIVLKRDMSSFTSNPRPEDVHLVAEVSDSTLHFDLTQKAQLYARAGIQEYWVLDVAGRRLIVHRKPAAGKWESVAAYGETDSVSPLAAPTAEFRAGQVLPTSRPPA